MISHLRGVIEEFTPERAVIDVHGVGYEVQIPVSTGQRLPAPGNEARLFIVESTSMYGGGTTLYGFFTAEERDTYLLLKDEVPGAGAKKALEYLDKVSKSIPDFKRAVLRKDISVLTGVFGFTKKTAEKIDSEVQKIVSNSYTKALDLLKTNRDKLDMLANALLEKETLYAAEIYELLGVTPRQDHRFA